MQLSSRQPHRRNMQTVSGVTKLPLAQIQMTCICGFLCVLLYVDWIGDRTPPAIHLDIFIVNFMCVARAKLVYC